MPSRDHRTFGLREGACPLLSPQTAKQWETARLWVSADPGPESVCTLPMVSGALQLTPDTDLMLGSPRTNTKVSKLPCVMYFKHLEQPNYFVVLLPVSDQLSWHNNFV